MKKRQTAPVSEEELLSFARSYLGEAYPNPQRIGCPSPQALQHLAHQPTEADPTISEHLGGCSPCFRQYQELLRAVKREQHPTRQRRRPLPFAGVSMYVGAGTALLLATSVCIVLWRFHRETIVHKIAEQTAKRVPTIQGGEKSTLTPFALDMSGASQVRGARSQPQPVITLPRLPLKITAYLPVGSDTGTYRVSLKQGVKIVWAGSAEAVIKNEQTIAQFRLDLSNSPIGRYKLTLSSRAGIDLSQTVDVGDQEHER